MNYMLIKCSFPSGHCSFAHPEARVGLQENCAIYKVTDIPNEINALSVLMDFDRTVIVNGSYEVKYADIGPGRKV